VTEGGRRIVLILRGTGFGLHLQVAPAYQSLDHRGGNVLGKEELEELTRLYMSSRGWGGKKLSGRFEEKVSWVGGVKKRCSSSEVPFGEEASACPGLEKRMRGR